MLQQTGVSIGLGSDFNPNSWFFSMQSVISFATYFMNIPPEDALKFSTSSNANSLLLENLGEIAVGKQADLVLFNVDDIAEISYQIGANNVSKVIKNGRVVYQNHL